MKRTLPRVIKTGAALLGLGTVGLTAAVALRQHRTFAAPLPEIHASSDPAVIERGRYLVYGPAHCADCHGSQQDLAKLDAGEEVPLVGGKEFHLPVGVFRVPNITTDKKHGIGRYSDPEIARLLRHGVRPSGEAVLPFMPFQNLASDDLRAVISFLRQQKPVEREVLPHEPNVLGRAVLAFVLEPRGPSEAVRERVEPEPTAEYGRYLANSVGNCVGCHTKIDMRTGEWAGPRFAGGAVHPSTSDPNKSFVTPNLTPHPTSGWLKGWSEDAFVARLKAGRLHEGSPMPWQAFKRMRDDDLRAIFRYLQTLPPAPGGPDPGDRRTVLQVAAR